MLFFLLSSCDPIEYVHGCGFTFSRDKLGTEEVTLVLLRIYTLVWNGFEPRHRGSSEGQCKELALNDPLGVVVIKCVTYMFNMFI